MDDIFFMCSSCTEVEGLLEQLNLLHPALTFTMEGEVNDLLLFLDVLIERSGISFTISIYRKPTFTAQYISWVSFSPKIRKLNRINTLVHRALLLYSSTKLDAELQSITEILFANGYPLHVIQKCVMDKILMFKDGTFVGPKKCPIYVNPVDWCQKPGVFA